MHAYDKILAELRYLDKELIEVDKNIRMRPSQCYRFSFDPVYLLFNTNCPDSLREKVVSIFNKYLQPSNSNDANNESSKIV
jgi:hypothetical protein